MAGALLFTPLSACDEIDAKLLNQNDVRIVVDKPDEVISADTVVCNRPAHLKRSGNTFGGKIYTGCDASPVVTVRLTSGRTALCQIGYVTSGIVQSWRFDLKDGVCRPTPEPVSTH